MLIILFNARLKDMIASHPRQLVICTIRIMLDQTLMLTDKFLLTRLMEFNKISKELPQFHLTYAFLVNSQLLHHPISRGHIMMDQDVHGSITRIILSKLRFVRLQS